MDKLNVLPLLMKKQLDKSKLWDSYERQKTVE